MDNNRRKEAKFSFLTKGGDRDIVSIQEIVSKDKTYLKITLRNSDELYFKKDKNMRTTSLKSDTAIPWEM